MQRTSTEAATVPVSPRRIRLRNRGSVEVSLDFLEMMTKYKKPTNIMHHANMNSSQYKQKREELESIGMIVGEEITPLGFTLIGAWKLIRSYFPHKLFFEEGWP